MQRAWFIVLGGFFVAVGGYACMYLLGTSSQRAVAQSDEPALAWLQQEYKLSNSQFDRVRELHGAYRPKCTEMCNRIDSTNAELQKLLATTNNVTPKIKQALAEAATIRAECEAAMLEHFYKVAKTMPPEQGMRYLAWVQQETLRQSQMMPGAARKAPSLRMQ